ncbi:L,D-transpeptidase family protein [Marinobacterium stanieri]|uniref:L,D-transpeptidase family protein n=1 Tax=Marinobacterium stanieri TaxID=49186 RepID=UPI0002558BE2|nr:L,D-transpeptidase family protein [Marinobacterium stanieri]
MYYGMSLGRYARILLALISLSVSPAFASADRVLVDKSDRKMTLYNQGHVVAYFEVSLGGAPQGHKTQEGDQKTPEGAYVLDYKNENSSFYRSLHVSYPNAVDRAQAEKRGVSPGGMIMVHGQRNGFGWLSSIMQNFDWTDGCIAITNDEMDEFMELVEPGTPIEIRW